MPALDMQIRAYTQTERWNCNKTDLDEYELERLNQTTKSGISQPRAQVWRKKDVPAAYMGLIRAFPGGGEPKPVI